MGKAATDIRKMSFFLVQHPLAATLAAGLIGVFAFFFPLLAYVSGVIVGLVALQRGSKEAFMVAIGAALPAGLMAFFEVHKAAIVFPLLLVLWFPNCICAALLRVTRSQGAALLTVGFFATLFVVAMHLFTDNVSAWWRHWLEQHVALVPGATVQGFVDEGSLSFMNGIVAMFFGISLMLTLLLARKWHALLHHSRAFRAEFHALSLPRMLALPVIGLAVMVAMEIVPGGGSLWADLLMVAVLMYLFQGVATLYALVAAKGWSAWCLAPLYFGVLVLPSLMIQGLALVGMAGSLAEVKAPTSPRA